MDRTTGVNMDRPIVDKRWIKPRHLKIIIPIAFIILIVLVLIFRDNTSVLKVERDKLTIEETFKGAYQDYISILGVVEPISYVYLDAVEGGMVERIMIEEGTMVRKGDIILRLSNTSLNLSILDSEAQLAEKSNFLRETRILMEQQKLNTQRELLQHDFDLIQKKRTYEQNASLYSDELISKEVFVRSKEDFDLALKMKDLTMERFNQDSIFRSSQIQKISLNLESMQKNLELIYQRQENLNVKAPVDGQLGLLNAIQGQSIGHGQRIGQINVLTSYKIKAKIDEHYIDRIKQGLSASFERQNDTFQLRLVKVYPEVREGQFQTDLLFTGPLPQNIRTGQSYHISLQLGETQEAIQIARGGFFQSTGGQWVYVISPDQSMATRKNIRIGRQNPKNYEVLEGLEPGEKVITSSYEMFGENERLVFK